MRRDNDRIAVTIPAAAELLGVSRTELFRLVREGVVPTFSLPGRRSRLVSVAWLREYVDRQTREAQIEQQDRETRLRLLAGGGR